MYWNTRPEMCSIHLFRIREIVFTRCSCLQWNADWTHKSLNTVFVCQKLCWSTSEQYSNACEIHLHLIKWESRKFLFHYACNLGNWLIDWLGFNAVFNNFSVISRRPVHLLMRFLVFQHQYTTQPGENTYVLIWADNAYSGSQRETVLY